MLGPLEATDGGHTLDLGGPKPRTLLAGLIVHQGRTVSVDWLIDTLWQDQPPPSATKTIQKYISRLRKHVGTVLVTRPGGYAVEVADDRVDARRFEDLIRREAASADQDLARQAIEGALALWAGSPYPELADTQIGMAEVARLTELRLSAVDRLMDLRLEAGEHRTLVGDLEELVSDNPLQEGLWAKLMLALYRSGRQSDALRAYQRLRHVLGNELGIEPSADVRALENKMLLQDPQLSIDDQRVHETNVAPSLTSFIGRKLEMSQLVDHVESRRLVTLTGPAGSGKTRLAREVGRARLESQPDGVWFVDLAPITSPDRVAGAVASPFDLSQTGDKPMEDVLAEHLEDKRLLLILDNCEHVISQAAAVVKGLLEAAPHISILTTSRQRLGISGELVYEVGPLPYPRDREESLESYEAVELFVDRAQLVHTSFAPDETELTHVGDICRALDGIPLAIELAAARARSLPPSELRRHLGERFAVLKATGETRADRHKTLLAAVDWSYQLLNHTEQVLLSRLSVFRGGFDLEAAKQVCGYPPLTPTVVLELLPELVEKSLVAISSKPSDAVRYFLLETLREFGQGNLQPGEIGELRETHADYFCRYAERGAPHLKGPNQQTWLQALKSDHDNLLKALRWASTTSPQTAVRIAIALGRYWDAVGPRTEGHEWLRRAVELSKRVDPRFRVDVLIEASDIFSSTHASQPRRYAEQALQEARHIGSISLEARSLRALAWALALEERPDEARQRALEALKLFERIDDPWETALCHERMGQLGYQDPEWAITNLQTARRMYHELGDRTREALALYKLAERIAQSGGDLDIALRNARESVAICDEIGNVHDGAHAKLELGKILRRLGDTTAATETLEEALQQLSRSGDERCSVRALTAMGMALIDAGKTERAWQTLRESLERGVVLDEKLTARVGLAGVARLASSDQPEKAIVLLGFADRLGADLAIPVSESSSDKRSRTLNDLHQRVGSGAYEAAWELGHSLQLEEAVHMATDLAPSDAQIRPATA